LISESAWEEMTCLFAPSLDEPTTKFFMNKPYDVLPKGEYGVVNKFNNATTVKPSSDLVAGNQDVANLQWDMPKPISDSQLA
ncbi:hypothetical protein BZY52_24385, partial [Enterobacter hormaechei]|uniref:hypothetical protein n=1 Tax=Enterobacter hormaechei TaxID=158836 RepID=UPI000B6DB7DA